MRSQSYLKHAYDTIWYQVISSEVETFTLSIIKYRLKSRYPLISGRIVRVPRSADHSLLSEGEYRRACETVEFRLKCSLSLEEMKKLVFRLLRDRFLQLSLA